MPRVLWRLHQRRPCIEIVLIRAADAQPQVRRLLADTGAGTAQSGFERLLSPADCRMAGGTASRPVSLRGAFAGQFPVFLIRVQIPALQFDNGVPAVAAAKVPPGFDGIACLRFL